MSEIRTNVRYNPRLTFDAWAKNLIELPQEHRIGYTVVTATQTFNDKEAKRSWKIDPRAKAFQDLVMAAVKAYGGVLEGKHFYFTRAINELLGESDYVVTLYVAER